MSVEEQFEKVYEEYHPKVMRLVLGYVKGDDTKAQDLVQDIFIKVWDNIPHFRGDSSMGTWIFRIAINTCLMFLRSRKALPLYTDQVQDRPDEDHFQEEQFQAMYHCIDQLSPKNRSIILMELQDLPQEEIAQIMGMTHEAIRTRIHRIKNKLSKCIDHDQF